ncbi:DUF5655 domain-containing protein [Nevskia soli]|uniref:DUF5655 domain-containing protein n=1 Tax=Nevskia soli TaxID=418856 RepID=UPI00068BF0C5|nr:DUF5655 domain-containing protein [Nevskia soli]
MAKANPPTYSVHPAVTHTQAIAGNLVQNTGRSLPAWLALVAKQKLADAKAIRQWLKDQHGLGGSTCMVIADAASAGSDWCSAEAYLRVAPVYVENLFAGPKAGLRPLYEELLGIGLKLGKDVKISPCKTFVPLYRKHVFAQLKPSTRTRLDLGLALGDLKAGGRLIDTGGFAKKDRITHRIAIAAAADIDAETKQWLAKAYALDAA